MAQEGERTLDWSYFRTTDNSMTSAEKFSFLGAAEGNDSQEKITSSGREQIESFIGAVSEKIHPPAPDARSNPGNAFPPRQVGFCVLIFSAGAGLHCLLLPLLLRPQNRSTLLLLTGHLLWTV